jgi:hypothetical protein
MRVKGKLIDIFFGADGDVISTDTLSQVIASAGDDRALFFTGGGYTRYIVDETDATHGLACCKFRNVRSDGRPTSIVDAFVDTDLPLLRVAEAYLTFAEAETRLNGPTAAAKEKIDALRNRAHAATPSSYSLDDIRDEWAKEFWFEGRRRMDLVRFGCFGGQSRYTWDWMGNSVLGSQFDATRNIFGLPLNDLTNNPNLRQNDGY